MDKNSNSPERSPGSSSELLNQAEIGEAVDARLKELAGKKPEIEVEKSASKAEAAREAIEKQALKSVEHKRAKIEPAESGEGGNDTWTKFTSQQKQRSFDGTMMRIRPQMKAPRRFYSRVIHNRTVEAVSETMNRTVARPSILLGAGIGGFLGLSILLFFSHRVGFDLSGSELPLLLLGGGVIGLASETVVRVIRYISRS